MTPCKFADIILVPFPFTDQSTTKKRPAVIDIEYFSYDRGSVPALPDSAPLLLRTNNGQAPIKTIVVCPRLFHLLFLMRNSHKQTYIFQHRSAGTKRPLLSAQSFFLSSLHNKESNGHYHQDAGRYNAFPRVILSFGNKMKHL